MHRALVFLLLIAIQQVAKGQVPQSLASPPMGISIVPLREEGHTERSSAPAPFLTVFEAYKARGDGSAVLIAPGGAYAEVSANLEGRQVADWFAARGITAFVLTYRVGADHPYPLPLEDAQRGMRLVRSLAERYKFMPNKVGMVGFSAGGHLAAMLGVTYDDGNPNSPDPVERYSDKPNFLVLAYPWLNAMQPNDHGLITYCSVLKDIPAEQCRSYEQRYTPLLHVTSGFPKTFLYITSDDKVVSVRGSVDFFQALIAAGVNAELHVFHHGEHASGLGSGDRALDTWPMLMEEWLRQEGFLAGWPGWGEQSRDDTRSQLTVKKGPVE